MSPGLRLLLSVLLLASSCYGQSCVRPNDTCSDAKYNEYDSYGEADAGESFLTRDSVQRRFPITSLQHQGLVRIEKGDLSGDWLLLTGAVGGDVIPPPAPIYTNPVSQPPSPTPSTDPVVYYNYPAAAIASFLAGLFFLVVFVPARAGIGKRSVTDSDERRDAVSSKIKELIAKADQLWNKTNFTKSSLDIPQVNQTQDSAL